MRCPLYPNPSDGHPPARRARAGGKPDREICVGLCPAPARGRKRRRKCGLWRVGRACGLQKVPQRYRYRGLPAGVQSRIPPRARGGKRFDGRDSELSSEPVWMLLQQQRRRRPHSSRYPMAFQLEEPPWRCEPRWPVLASASLGERDVPIPLSISLEY